MQRIKHNLIQGSAEWHAFRATHFGASEASAMLGISPYKTRDELLAEKKTGLTKEVNAVTQKIFDNGHAVEKLALPIAEKLTGVELSPVTMSYGILSASCDGLDFDDIIAWENKQFNKDHFYNVSHGSLPKIHWPQCQQVLYVTGAEKLYFTISDGTPENTVGMWIYPDKLARDELERGWAQFERDLETFVPPTIINKVEAETIQALPVPSVVVRGEITTSNLTEITPKFDAYLSSIKTELSSDQDFADAEANAKNCRETAKRIEALRENIIAQMVDVNAVDSALSNYQDAFNKVGLRLEKAVKEQKETLKTNEILKAQQVFIAHVQALEAETRPIRLNVAMPDFAGAIKGIKTISSMQSRINDALASGKIAADACALDIRTKMTCYKLLAKNYEFLFNDLSAIIYKAMDDFQLLVNSRISTHKQAELEKEAAIKSKAEADARAKVEAEQREKELAEKAEIAKTEAEEKHEQELNIYQPALKYQQVLSGVSLDDGTFVAYAHPDLNLEFIAEASATEVLNPTRAELISDIAFLRKVSEAVAEQWLINQFSSLAKAA